MQKDRALLGDAACVGPTRHALDSTPPVDANPARFAQAATSWPDASAEDRKAGASLAETTERISTTAAMAGQVKAWSRFHRRNHGDAVKLRPEAASPGNAESDASSR